MVCCIFPSSRNLLMRSCRLWFSAWQSGGWGTILSFSFMLCVGVFVSVCLCGVGSRYASSEIHNGHRCFASCVRSISCAVLFFFFFVSIFDGVVGRVLGSCFRLFVSLLGCHVFFYFAGFTVCVAVLVVFSGPVGEEIHVDRSVANKSRPPISWISSLYKLFSRKCHTITSKINCGSPFVHVNYWVPLFRLQLSELEINLATRLFSRGQSC